MVADLAGAVALDTCHLRIPGLPEWIEPAVDYLIGRARLSGAVHPDQASRVMMALYEALTNSVIHGNLGISSALKEEGDAFTSAIAARRADPRYAGRVVDIRASYDGRTARWTFTDEGDGFDVEAVLGRLDAPGADPPGISGRGLMMIRAFIDEMRYEDHGRRLVLTLRRRPAAEKRLTPRRAVARSVHVAPVEDGCIDRQVGQAALARNISPDGMAFLQAQHAAGSRVLITIPTAGEPIALPAEVRHWHALGENIVEVGCRFETPLPLPPGAPAAGADGTARALSRLVSQLAEQLKPLQERRSAPRVPYTECIRVEVPGQPATRGFARDLSRSGIAFLSTTSLPAGVLHLGLPAANGQSTIHVRAKVVRCNQLSDGFYDVGACFLRR